MNQCAREKKYLYNFEAGKVMADFREVDDEAESYFSQYAQREYLMEYYFETVPQLKAMLDKLWESEAGMQGAIKTLVAATIKNKPIEDADSELNDEQGITELPEFIYNF